MIKCERCSRDVLPLYKPSDEWLCFGCLEGEAKRDELRKVSLNLEAVQRLLQEESSIVER